MPIATWPSRCSSPFRATPRLRVGQFVTVLAGTDTEQAAWRCHGRRSVRAGNGRTFVYEHTSAERFEARPVRVEPLDAAGCWWLRGSGPASGVVTQGAELLDQVR